MPELHEQPSAVLEWVDAVADRFEAAWKEHGPARITDFLGDAAGDSRSALLHELVKLDLEFRGRAGQPRRLEEYLADFPELRGTDGDLPDDLVLHARKVRERFAAAAPGNTVPAPEPAPGEASTALRCPHCRNAIPAVEPDARKATCPHCGGSFGIEPRPAVVFRAGDLPRTLGKFQLLELVGHGTFGAVYRARDTELHRTVAVKVPRVGSFATAEEEERFLNEARAAARLVHPHIVPVHDIGRDGHLPYIVSDFIAGRTLEKALKEQRPGFREAAGLVAQVAEALDYAHGQGIVHRDVKPGNILMDEAGQPHVTDFGLARLEEESVLVTLEGQVLGTAAYMSPEQAAGEQAQVDGRSDVYSLGVILYEMLTGEVPFRGTLSRILEQVRHEEPRPPRKWNDRIPRDLETVCLKCLEKEPGRRYATAADLADDLRRWLKGEPTWARPVGPVGRAWRWCRRNPRIAALRAAVATLLVAVAVGAVVIRSLAEQKRQKDQEHQRQLEQLAQQSRLAKQQLRVEAAEIQAARGLLLLERNDSLGLLDVLEGYKKVADIAHARESTARLWSGWYTASAGRLAQVVQHDGPVMCVAFSPDGKLLATAAGDETARVWDADTGLPHGGLFSKSPVQAIHGVSFSPDGKLLAVVSGEGTAEVWETATGKAYRKLRPPDKPDVSQTEFSPEGRWLAVVSGRGIQLWDLASGLPHGAPLGHADQLLGFSPDGSLLAAASGNDVVLWDTATLTERATLSGHTRGVTAAAFSQDGKRVATYAFEDRTARLWNTTTGKPCTAPFLHPDNVHAVALSPDGKLLATGCFDGSARLWDTTSGQLRSQLRHDGPVETLAFSPDGTLLATGSFDSTARLWDPATGQPYGWPLRHQGVVSSVVFSTDGKRLATASVDRTARIWNIAADVRRVLPHDHRVWGVAFSPDSKLLATVSEDKLAHLWETATARATIEPVRHPALALVAVAISPDGRLLATAGAGAVHFWETATGLPSGQAVRLQTGPMALAFSPDGSLIATGGEGQAAAAQLWDTASREARGQPMPHGRYIGALAFSPDGMLLATASAGSDDVLLWDTATGQVHGPPLSHGGWVEAVAFSPDGKLLATGGRDMTVRLWDPATGHLHGPPFRQQASVEALTFSPDGKLLAAGCQDGTVRLLDVDTGLPCLTLRHERWVSAVAFSPDGNWLATGSFDKTARLWPVPQRTITDVREMELRTWVALGARLDEQGVAKPIPWEEWHRLRDELQALEGR